jgi:hypothetical protein
MYFEKECGRMQGSSFVAFVVSAIVGFLVSLLAAHVLIIMSQQTLSWLLFLCGLDSFILLIVEYHSRRPLSAPRTFESQIYTLPSSWNATKDGELRTVDIAPGVVAVGSSKGSVHIFTFGHSQGNLRAYLTIPAPPATEVSVISSKLSISKNKTSVFVAYSRVSKASSPRSTAGLCCYDMPTPSHSAPSLSAPSARHDLDGRYVVSSSLCDAVETNGTVQFTVASQFEQFSLVISIHYLFLTPSHAFALLLSPFPT